MRYENGTTGELISSPDFWALVDRRREEGKNRLRYSYGAFIAADGTWYWPENMNQAERDRITHARERDLWWEKHERDPDVIPDLSSPDLKLFRLLADIRNDIPLINAADDELRKRGIHDFPIAI